MTRTIKKWLLAVLLFVMAVTVGFTAFTAINSAFAAEVDATTATNFVGLMGNFDGKVTKGDDGAYTFTAEDTAKFFGNDVDGAGNYGGDTDAIKLSTLWSAHRLARNTYTIGGYASLTTEQIAAVEVEGFADAVAMYKAIDSVVSEYYVDASIINYNMNQVVLNKDNFLYDGNNGAYYSAAQIKDFHTKVEGYKDIANYGNGVYGFIKAAAGNNFGLLAEAREIVKTREALITDFTTAVGNIAYTTTESGKVVTISSGPSIKTAGSALDELPEQDVTYLLKDDNGAAFGFKAKHEEYTAAKAAYEALAKAVHDFEQKILALYKAVAATTDNKYTLLIDETDGYSALLSHYNGLADDEKALVDSEKEKEGELSTKTYKDLLDELKETLDGLNANIAAVKGLIDDITGYATKTYTGYYKDAKGENGYTDDYRGTIKKARDAFDALELDIKDHDKAATENYYVENYAALTAAEDVYAGWDTTVSGIIVKAEALANAVATGESGYIKMLEYVNDVENARFSLQMNGRDDQLNFVNAQLIEGGETSQNIDAWLAQASIITSKIGAVAGTLITDIDNYEYTFATQKNLVTLLQTYYGIEKAYRQYVNNSAKLLGYATDYEADLAKVSAWQDKVAAVTEGLVDGKIDVTNMSLVAAAAKEYAKLLNEENSAKDIPAYYAGYTSVDVVEGTDVTGKSLTGEDPLTEDEINALLNGYAVSYNASKAAYDNYYGAYNELNTKVNALVALFDSLVEKKPFNEVSVTNTKPWSDNMDGIATAIGNLAVGKEVSEYVSYAGAVAYVLGLNDKSDEHVSYNDTYEEAKTYAKVYDVEGAIVGIWENYTGTEIDWTKDPTEEALAYISLNTGIQDAIIAAKAALKEYKDGEGDDTLIRNIKFLEEAEKVSEQITKELDDWAKSVDAFVVKEITLIGSEGTGYGFELTAWDAIFNAYAKLVCGENGAWEASEEGTVTVWLKGEGEGAEYTATKVALNSTPDPDKVAYQLVAKAYAKLLAIYEKGNAAVADVDAAMLAIIDKGVDSLTPDDYKTVVKINKIRDEQLGKTQVELLKNGKTYSEMNLSAVTVANAFIDLVDDLAAKEVTAFTGIYADMLQTIYNQFDANVKALITADGNCLTKLEGIKTTYEEKLEAKEIPDYTAEIEALKEGKVDTTTLEAELEKVNTAIAGVETAFANADTALKGELEAAIAAAKAELEEKLEAVDTKLAAAIAAAKADLEKAIAAAKAELEGKITALETVLNEYKEAESAARVAGDKELADEITAKIAEVNTAITNAKKALEGDIQVVSDGLKTANTAITAAQNSLKDLQSKLDAVEKRVEALENSNAQLKQENTELKNANSELNKQVKDLKGTLSGVIAGVVIVGVALGAAIAAFVAILYLRKKR